MLIRELDQAHYFTALDRTTLCELLHPDRADGTPALPYSLAHAVLPPGVQSLPHRLRAGTEVYYILAGTGRMQIDGEDTTVNAGQVIYIPPGAVQCLRNTGADSLAFLCLVSPPWHADDEELVTDFAAVGP